MAFSFKHKGLLRNVGGFFRSPTLKRLKVLLGLSQDPFDCYAWLDELHQRQNLEPLYFFLLANKNGVYDKNILSNKKGMRELIHQHAQKYTLGIHPSWQSGDRPNLFESEKKRLEAVSQMPVTRSRQHYIRFILPESYRQVLQNGITNEYSMGYGSINGFRASAASPFYWYDLERNESTMLRVHPFCFMDANSFYEQKLTAVEAFNELIGYYSACKSVGAQMITIWHNNFLGTEPKFSGWKDIYERFITHIKIKH